MSKATIGGAKTNFQKEDLSGSLISININHARIHQGISFSSGVNDTSLALNASISIAFKTPTDREIHIMGEATSSLSAVIDILEVPTITVSTGTLRSVINRNRISDITSRVIDTSIGTVGSATINPTITDDGTAIASLIIGQGNNRAGGVFQDANEFILKKDTVYATRLTSSAAGNFVQIQLFWYEAS